MNYWIFLVGMNPFISYIKLQLNYPVHFAAVSQCAKEAVFQVKSEKNQLLYMVVGQWIITKDRHINSASFNCEISQYFKIKGHIDWGGGDWREKTNTTTIYLFFSHYLSENYK